MRIRELKRVLIAAFVLVGTGELASSQEGQCFWQLLSGPKTPGNYGLLSKVKLVGTANGGELVLLEMLNASPRYIRLETRAGEPAEEVISRLAAAINEISPFNPYRAWARIPNERGEIVPGDQVPIVCPQGNLLGDFGGAPGGYIFAGTETGLGIPPPPTSLSVSYDPQTQQVSLHWENPDEPYDAVSSYIGGVQGGHATTAIEKSSPPRKRYIPPKRVDRAGFRDNKGLRRFDVIGCRDGVLSNAAVITLNYEDNSQEELDTLPFTGGIAPNWKRWAATDTEMLVLEQGSKGEWKRFDQAPKAALAPDDKPLYQLIRTRSPAVVGGVWRKFLGLKPEHTYRLWVRMNTFAMDETHENWSFSFHATPHESTVTLTPAQMAGTTPLPDGSSGDKAGLIAAYGAGATTKGKFAEIVTGEQGSDAQALDITLPPDAQVITVWFRLTGAAPSGVGFDWIKLKDMTASQ